MADDKKNIPETAPPAEAPAPAVENAAVLEQPSPGPALIDAEAVMLEHEGQAALFEMGEAVPDPADAVTYTEVEKPAAPEVPKAEKEQAQPPDPGKDAPAPAHSGKVVSADPPHLIAQMGQQFRQIRFLGDLHFCVCEAISDLACHSDDLLSGETQKATQGIREIRMPWVAFP